MRELPDGWEYRRVDRVGDVQLGRQRSPAMMTGPYMRPYLRVANVLDGYIDYSDVLEMNFSPHEAQTFGLQRGDILLNEGQALDLVGRCSVFNGPPGMCFQNTLLRFRPHAVLPKFAAAVFKHWLDHGEFRKITRQTTSIAHLGSVQFAAMRFPYAPPPEQHRIAEILDSADSNTKATLNSIAKLQATRMATISSLLTLLPSQPSRFENLGELARETVLGTTAREVDDFHPTLTLVKMGSLRQGIVTLAQTETISVRQIPNISDITLRDNDLLFNTRNTPELVGKAGVWHIKESGFVPDNNLMIIRFKPKINSDYCCLQLTHGEPSRKVRSLATGTTSVAAIYWRDLRKVELPILDLPDQLKIIEQTRVFDDQIKVLQNSLAKIRALKQGLMDDLLTGRVRVTVLYLGVGFAVGNDAVGRAEDLVEVVAHSSGVPKVSPQAHGTREDRAPDIPQICLSPRVCSEMSGCTGIVGNATRCQMDSSSGCH
jgi:type I restriction enzyme, S subunit